MKIAICSKGDNLQSEIDDRFGRAGYFIIFDTETDTFEAIINSAKDAAHGAGGNAVKLISESGATIAIGAKVGPKAEAAARAFELTTIEKGDYKTVEDAIKGMKNK